MVAIQEDLAPSTFREAPSVEGLVLRFIPRRLWVPCSIFLVDALALQGSFQLAILARQAVAPLYPIELDAGAVAGMGLVILIIPLVFWISGLTPGYGIDPIDRLRRRVVVTASVFATFLAWDYLVQGNEWSRGVLLATLMFAFVLPPMAVSVLRTALVRRGCWGEPVALLGSANAAAGIARILREHPELGLVPAGIFDDDPDKWHTIIEGIPVLGPLTNGELARTKARTGILVDPVADPDRLADLIARLPFEKVLILPDLLGVQSLWVTTRDLGGILALEVKNNLRRLQNRILKMAFDYALGVILLIVFLPFIGIFALWIKWVSPGPFLFCQVREGLNGRKFRMWKLRTMYPDADSRLEEHLELCADSRVEWHRFMKLKNDPRVLPVVGHFLRRWSLDEMPQLWNVVRGEMSLVGPRPFPEYHLDQFKPDFQRLRRQVRPGVTGLWQVMVRSEGDLAIQQSLDTYYIRYWSLWQDLFILCRTPGVVLGRRGAA